MAAPILNTGLDEPLDAGEQAALNAEQQGQITEKVPAQQPPEGQPAPDAAKGAEKPPVQAKVPEAVPYERFREVNEARQREGAQLAEMREKWARLEERAKLAREADERIQREAAKATRPDETIDPHGAALWDRDQRIAQLEQNFQQLQQGLGQTSQQMQAQNEWNNYTTWVRDDVAAVQREKPDYNQAAQYVTQRIVAFAQALGADEEKQQAFVGALTDMATRTARVYGKSPAAAYYDLAKSLGYTGAAPTTTQTQPSAAEVARLKLEQAQKGQAMQGLNRAPNEIEDNMNWTTLGAKDLAEMDEDEFAARWADPKQRPILERLFSRLEMGAGA